MVPECVVPTVKYGEGGVMGCFAGDTIGDLIKIEGTLNWHYYHSILLDLDQDSGLAFLYFNFLCLKELLHPFCYGAGGTVFLENCTPIGSDK